MNIKSLKLYIKLLRPKHWIKNILLFVPIVYSHNLTNLTLFLATLQCFVAFCLISSMTYVVNDIADMEKDRQHPIKKLRPIACGLIRVKNAAVFAIFLFVMGFTLTFIHYGNSHVMLYAVLYIMLTISYSFFLKNFAIVDCFCIASGFIFRIFAGGAASGDIISEWLFLTMTAVSLFMAFGKRRGEIIRVSDSGDTRKALASYNLSFLNGMIFVCTGLSVVFYALWAITNNPAMVYTVPLVIFIVCRYLLIVHNNTSHGDPTSIICGDKELLVALGAFELISLALLYI